MDEQTILKELVSRLVAAENAGCDGGREEADTILAANFLGITRAGTPPGARQEQTRDELLDTIGAAKPNSPRRELDSTDPDSGAWPVGDTCWVVKGAVTTVNGRFRNMYVFSRQAREWLLLAWQVTKLDQ